MGISAQPGYYFNTIFSAGQNPGNLNNDPEEPLGFTAGYDALISANAAIGYSPIQTIPFVFDFNGAPVISYKVSISGVLTFTTSTTLLPSSTNDTIPNSSIPNSSIMIWGLQKQLGDDAIAAQTYRNEPNRQ